MEQIIAKTCSKCKIEKSISEFSFANKKKGTYAPWCKDCYKKYRKDNKTEITKKRKQYEQDNKEILAQKKHDRYEANKEEKLAYNRQYYQDNKEDILEQKQQYYYTNQEIILEKARQYWHANKDWLLPKKHQYYQNNKEKLLEQKRQYYYDNQKVILEKARQFRLDNIEMMRERDHQSYQRNKESKLKSVKRYRDKNKAKSLAYHRQYKKDRSARDPIYKLRRMISRAVNKELKRNGISKRGVSVAQYIDVRAIKDHITALFNAPENLHNGKPWMNWKNQGIYNINTWDDNKPETKTWHLDHIIPQSYLPHKSMDEENCQICWMPENCRPLPAKQNVEEGDNITEERRVLIEKILDKLPKDVAIRVRNQVFAQTIKKEENNE